jgi:tetratricopeptide (TPR) repeat protein
LKRYDAAIQDATAAISLKPNTKSFLRRAKAYFCIGRYQDAIVDVDGILEDDENNQEAIKLRREIVNKWKDVDYKNAAVAMGEVKTSRMKIVESEQLPPVSDNSMGQHPLIVDVDEDSEESDSEF